MADENQQTNPQPLPESASVDDAVELMAGLDPASPEATRDAQDEQAEQEPEFEPEQESEQEHEQGPETDAPEFWSAEDKASWAQVPAELRPVLKKYEQQRIEFVNEKAREAAQFRDAVAAELRKANDTVDQAASWWQQAGPALQRAFTDKWAQVNWVELAEKNPAEWARLNQLRMDEASLLTEAHRRGQADIEAARQRATITFQQAKQTEHAKVAARYPDYFGTAEKAARTYEELGNFLHSKGVPTERINTIYEAPIIELALMAYRYDQAQRKASGVTNAHQMRAGATKTTGNAAPTRVQPGPPSRAGNRAGEAARQVGERFRRSGGASIADAAELIRLSGL